MKHKLMTLCGIVAAVGICIAYGGAADEIPSALPSRPDPELVDGFDRIIQRRFHDLRTEDIEKGRLGVSRIAGVFSSHGLLFRPETPVERLSVEQIRAAGWSTALYVASVPRDAQLMPRVTGPILTGKAATNPNENFPSIARIARTAGLARTSVASEAPGLFLEARPVVASRSACLGCHRGKQVGDPLGIVVYAFRRSAPLP